MIKIFAIVIVIFFVCSPTILAQTTKSDTLSLSEGFFGMTYKKGDQKISFKEFKQILKSSADQSIYTQFVKGDNQSTLADVIAFCGGGCVGYGLASKPSNSTVAIVGGVIVVVAFILDGNAKGMMNEAVLKYNNLTSSSAMILPELKNGSQGTLFVISTHF